MGSRRAFLTALSGLLAWPRLAVAQQTERTYRVGWLSTAALRTESYNLAFVDRLREVGFVEGRNLVIEFRSGQGRIDRLSELAANLARQNCDVFLAPGTERNLAAIKQASRESALRHRLPSMYGNTLWAEAGGLLSYAPNFSEFYRREADQMSLILKGAKPAEMPVEQPTTFELVINLRTAKALGITIVQSLRTRADRVIE
jgi:ABC-type uncharacterized transport system substrate-binding protein